MAPGAGLGTHFNDFVEVVVDGLDDDAAAEGFEPVGAVGFDGVVFVGDGVLQEECEDDVVDPDAVEFDDVVDEDWAVVVVAVEDSDVGVDAGFDERAFDFAVEHAVAIVEEGIGDVHGGVLAAGVEAVFFGEEEVEGFEIDFGCDAFPAAEGGGDVGDHFAVDGGDFGAVVFEAADGGGDFVFDDGVVGLHHEEEGLLVFDFLAEDFFDPVECFVGEGEVELPFADGGDGAVFGAPDAAEDFAGLVDEEDFDFVFDGEEDGVAGDLRAFADLDGFDAFGWDALTAFGIGDDEALVVAVEAGAVGVEDEFHGVIADKGCRRRGGGFLWRG